VGLFTWVNMYLFYKRFLSVFLLMAAMLCPTISSAQDCSDPDNSGAIEDFVTSTTSFDNFICALSNMESDDILPLLTQTGDELPLYSSVLPGSAFAFVCDIRKQMFCGRALYVIIATSVFFVGMLILMEKMQWGYGILIIAFIVLVVKPESLPEIIMGNLLGWTTKVCVCFS